MSKLTLSVDEGVSVSKMVEDYLAAVANPSSGVAADTPVLRSVRGKQVSMKRILVDTNVVLEGR